MVRTHKKKYHRAIMSVGGCRCCIKNFVPLTIESFGDRVINGSPADTWIFNRVTPVEDKDKSGKIKNLKSYKLNKKKHRLRCPNKDL